MSKVITFNRTFPPYHSKAGQPTYFVEKFWKSLYEQDKTEFMYCEREYQRHFPVNYNSDLENIHNHKPKNHTIRSGSRFKKGDYFSPRVWGTDVNPKSKRIGPYHSKQIIIGPDTLITDVFDFQIDLISKEISINGKSISPDKLEEVAENDGLLRHDLQEWFKYPKPFSGQIICWNANIQY